MSETPMGPERAECTCARVGAHSERCAQYTPGHDLASPQLEIERLRAEWRRLRDRCDRHHEVLRHVDEAYNSLMDEVQRYAEGAEQPVLWSVYNRMHGRAATAENEVRNLRAELDARPSRAEVLRQEARTIVAYCLEHGDGDTCWPECHCPVAEDMLRRAGAEQGATEPGSPTPLRWGQDDVELGDDDSVTLWLSGPAGEPYVLELEPERAADLRGLLAGTVVSECHCEPQREHDDLTLPASYLHQVGCPVADREQQEVRRG